MKLCIEDGTYKLYFMEFRLSNGKGGGRERLIGENKDETRY